MSCCNNLKKESKCAKFTTAHGPSTKVCDQYMDKNCGLFQQLYNGEAKPSASCFNNQIGKEYICPKVSSGKIASQPLGNWFQSQQTNHGNGCCTQSPNIGVHQLCPYQYTPADEVVANESAEAFSNYFVDEVATVNTLEGGSRKKNKGRKHRNKNMSGGGCGRPNPSENPTKVKGLKNCDKGYNRPSYGPEYNSKVLALGKPVYQPTPTPLLGYGYGTYPGCPYNPTCCCGPECACGPSCCCGQTNAYRSVGQAMQGQAVGEAVVGQAMQGQVGGGCGAVPAECDRDEGKKYSSCAVPRSVLEPKYSCEVKQCIIAENGCPKFDSTCRPSSNYQFICGNKTRCGNGELGTQQGCGCNNCQEVIPKIWNQPINPYRTYGINQPEEVPGYILDLSKPHVGGRPVWTQSNSETIPKMMLVNKTNLPGRCFGCTEPCWNEKCL